jgi:hypothetical protein
MNPVNDALSVVDDIADKIWPSQDEKLQHADLIAQLKALPSVQAMQLRMAQVNLTNTLASGHNFFLSLGLGLIYFSCGFAIFNDYFILKLLAYIGIHLQPMSDGQIMSLLYLLLGGGTVHISHTLVTYPPQFAWVGKLKSMLNRGSA